LKKPRIGRKTLHIPKSARYFTILPPEKRNGKGIISRKNCLSRQEMLKTGHEALHENNIGSIDSSAG
jgi:hypothetical protein